MLLSDWVSCLRGSCCYFELNNNGKLGVDSVGPCFMQEGSHQTAYALDTQEISFFSMERSITVSV